MSPDQLGSDGRADLPHQLEPMGWYALLSRRRSALGFWQEWKRTQRERVGSRRNRRRDENKAWCRIDDWVLTDRTCTPIVEALVSVAPDLPSLAMIGTWVLETRIDSVGLAQTKQEFAQCRIEDNEREAILKGVYAFLWDGY